MVKRGGDYIADVSQEEERHIGLGHLVGPHHDLSRLIKNRKVKLGAIISKPSQWLPDQCDGN